MEPSSGSSPRRTGVRRPSCSQKTTDSTRPPETGLHSHGKGRDRGALRFGPFRLCSSLCRHNKPAGIFVGHPGATWLVKWDDSIPKRSGMSLGTALDGSIAQKFSAGYFGPILQTKQIPERPFPRSRHCVTGENLWHLQNVQSVAKRYLLKP